MNRTDSSSPMPRTRGRGFVLLEIVMAMGLFAMVAVGMTQALNQIAQTSKLARQEAQLLRTLESALAEVMHQPQFEQTAYAFPQSDEGIDAAATVEEVELFTEDEALLDHMFRIRVEAWLKDGAEEVMRRSIETYVYSPHSTL